jgi:hypothetical protein
MDVVAMLDCDSSGRIGLIVPLWTKVLACRIIAKAKAEAEAEAPRIAAEAEAEVTT